MNVTTFKTMNYEQRTMNDANKNKPNQTQFQRQKNAQARLFRRLGLFLFFMGSQRHFIGFRRSLPARIPRDHVNNLNWGVPHDPAYYNLTGGSGFIAYLLKKAPSNQIKGAVSKVSNPSLLPENDVKHYCQKRHKQAEVHRTLRPVQLNLRLLRQYDSFPHRPYQCY